MAGSPQPLGCGSSWPSVFSHTQILFLHRRVDTPVALNGLLTQPGIHSNQGGGGQRGSDVAVWSRMGLAPQVFFDADGASPKPHSSPVDT